MVPAAWEAAEAEGLAEAAVAAVWAVPDDTVRQV